MAIFAQEPLTQGGEGGLMVLPFVRLCYRRNWGKIVEVMSLYMRASGGQEEREPGNDRQNYLLIVVWRRQDQERRWDDECGRGNIRDGSPAPWS